jgi:thioredoxin-dependent peroxiredoxin
MLKEGDNAPEGIELQDQDGNLVKLDDLKGKKTIFYTYPKDNTPGCTTEAKNFRDSIKDYEGAGIRIIGISADSVTSHKNFATKYDLPFTLLSDPDKVLLKALGSIVGGKIKRRTWLVDESWKIEKAFEAVSPSKHNGQLCEYYLLKN